MKDLISNILKVITLFCFSFSLILFYKYIKTIEEKNRFVPLGDQLVLDSKTGAVYHGVSQESKPVQFAPPIIK